MLFYTYQPSIIFIIKHLVHKNMHSLNHKIVYNEYLAYILNENGTLVNILIAFTYMQKYV